MSIKLMSAIFETEFRDLQDEDGNTTKATSAKIVCLSLADHANDEGEGAYPGLKKMTVKTALTKQCIINAYDALKYNGIISLIGTSKRGTNNYTVNPSSFPKANEGNPRLLVISVESQGKPGLPEPVNLDYPNHTLTVIESSLQTDEEKGDYIIQANKKVDALLDMANFPGAKREARVNSILSYLGEIFHVNTETKAWREFAKYADGQNMKEGQDIKVFVAWVRSQKGFDLQYWPPAKMQERWPGAFVKDEEIQSEYETL